MGSMSIWHWVIVALVVMLLFGKGRLSDMMGDLAKGIKSFKAGMADDPMAPTSQPYSPPPAPPLQVTQAAPAHTPPPAYAPPPVHPVAPPVAATPEPMATMPPPQDPTHR